MRRNYNTKIIGLVCVIIIIIIGVIVTIAIKNNEAKYKVELVDINEEDVKYYVFEIDEKYGILDKEGNVIIEPMYSKIQIPNPTMDIFIVSKDEKKIVVNSQNNQILNEFEEVGAISIKKTIGIVPYEKTVLKYKQGNFYGLIDFTGKKIVDAKYEEISGLDYKEGFLKVKLNDLYGIINIKGTKIIDTEYDNITVDGYYDKETKYKEDGYILRIKNNDGYKFGYANKNGKIIIEPQYSELTRLTELDDNKANYFISSLNGRYGYLKDGKKILENEYQEILFDKGNKLLIVTKNKIKGTYDLEGKNIIPIDYNNITIGGDYLVATKDETKIIFNPSGEKIDTKIESHNRVSDNYSIIIDENGYYNVVDNNNNKLLKDKYIYIDYFNSNMFIVTTGAHSGIIDSNENVVVPIEYSSIQKIFDTNVLKAVDSSVVRTDIITAGGSVSTGIDNALIDVTNDYIKLYSETDVKYFTKDGRETTYQELYPNNSIYAIKQNGKWGFADKSGKVVIKCIYDMVTEQNGKTAGIRLENKWGIIDTQGEIVLEPVYVIDWQNVTFLNNYYKIEGIKGVPVYSGTIRE